MKQTKKNSFFIILAATLVIIISTLIIFTTLKNSPSNNYSDELNGCIKAGCSGQLCIEKKDDATEGVTDCKWKESYKCLKSASCERQKTGKCGFTQTKESTKCLDELIPKINLQKLVY